MRLHDCKEIIRWTFLSGVLVFASIGARSAWSGAAGQIVRASPAVTVDGCTYVLDAAADGDGAVTAKLFVTNKTDRQATLDLQISSIDRTFKGSLVSRVLNPADFEEKLVDRTAKRLSLPAAGSTTARFTLKRTPADSRIQAAPGKRPPTPMVAIAVAGKRILLAPVKVAQVAAISR